MATLADREIIATKRPLSVMTRHTAKPSRGSVVIQRLRRCHFVSLRRGQGAMTSVTVKALVSVVVLVAETNFESARHLAGACEPSAFVAQAARRDIAVTRFRLRTVTLEARGMGAEPRGNSHGDTGPRGSMTASTGNTSLAQMSSVAKLHIEAA